jgi:hypothetical protein
MIDVTDGRNSPALYNDGNFASLECNNKARNKAHIVDNGTAPKAYNIVFVRAFQNNGSIEIDE